MRITRLWRKSAMPTLEWIGKSKVINHHQEAPFRVLERKYSFDENGQHNEDNGSENMIIRGDNLEALKALLPRYEGRIKCIYIDPPYNTGNEGWVYNDNVNDPKIKKWLGEVVGKEGEDLTRHDKWLCMMYPRLKLLQKLLADDGVIFISIDDTECSNLILICNEIFGASNFVANVSWQRTYSPRNDSKGIVSEVEHLVVFSKNPGWQPNKLPRTEAMDSRYKNPDNDVAPWKSSDAFAPGAATHQGMVYAIQHPFTGEMLYPSNGRCWRYQQSSMLEYMQGWCNYRLENLHDEKERARVCGIDESAVRKDVLAIVLEEPLEVSAAAESTLLFNKAPYQNVIVLGHVQDENGQKMSKSKGNAVDPFDALQTYGADAIRWYFYINSAPWLPNRFHGKAVQEGQRKFMSTLWNTYAFFVLYANIDEFDATKYTLDYDKLSVMDKWLLSKLNTVIQTVDDNLNNYRIPEAARALQEFVDDMSNWYVRRSRERFWAKGMEQDKINAYMTLYTSLVTISKVAAPMIPFMTEDIYQNLVRSIDKDAPESIHLCDFPVANKEWIDKDLEANMDHLLNVVVMGRACRNTANIKNRQPIAAMYVKAPYGLSEYFTAIIADELNVKEVKFTDNIENFISYSFKPQLKTVGPKYGKLLNGIRKALSELDGNKAMAELRANGELKLDIDGNEVVLSEEDLLIETAQMEGYVTESDNDIAVVLDTNLTPELIEEGFVREIISKIQTMRKEAGFEVMDKIQVYVKDNKVIEDIMKAHAEEIQAEVLAEKLLTDTAQGYVKSWNINSQEVTLGVEKMN